ncbi:MAG TPA: DUF4136 domain-containing protein [Hydrogenophaga sp.]|nr:DUF4136 domain-containing protein [Hydrogenophaga sp.]
MKPALPAPLASHSPSTSWARLARTAGLALAIGTLGALGGCAGVMLVDNQVESFASWTPTAGAAPATAAVPSAPQSYRFERLPSQREGRSARSQDELEALAQTALAKAGWTPAAPGASAPWQVQVSANTQSLPRAPWDDPWMGHWGGGFWGDPWHRPGPGFGISAWHGHPMGVGGHIVWSPMFMHMDLPYYKRELSLVIRRADNGQVVYETRAAHDGRWNSTPALWSAMLDAALQGFPVPPSGPRQVNIEIPR